MWVGVLRKVVLPQAIPMGTREAGLAPHLYYAFTGIGLGDPEIPDCVLSLLHR